MAAAWYWRGRDRRRPLRLKQVGTVSRLFIYPIKSCKGVAVQQAEVTKLGLRDGDLRDRCWLVIKEDGHMVTARQEPRLVLVSITSQNGYLTLSAPEMKDCRIPVKLSTKNPVRNCRLFGFDVQGRDCGEDAAQWITAHLKSEPYRLVCFEPNMVPRNSKDLMEPFRPTDKIAYSDCSPIMLLSEASLEELNSRLEKKVQIRNFRPSILVTGCGPYEEDTWNDIIIGSAQMKGAAACPRRFGLQTQGRDCGDEAAEWITTFLNTEHYRLVHYETNMVTRKPCDFLPAFLPKDEVAYAEGSPLLLISEASLDDLNTSYRKCDPSEEHDYKSNPPFGWLYGVEETGILEVGDPVYKIIS
ncbi:MOSC domain-containing protein 2, mitochondrial, partial [Ophiophagus hannah]